MISPFGLIVKRSVIYVKFHIKYFYNIHYRGSKSGSVTQIWGNIAQACQVFVFNITPTHIYTHTHTPTHIYLFIYIYIQGSSCAKRTSDGFV